MHPYAASLQLPTKLFTSDADSTEEARLLVAGYERAEREGGAVFGR